METPPKIRRLDMYEGFSDIYVTAHRYAGGMKKFDLQSGSEAFYIP